MKRKFVKRDNLFRTVILTLFPKKSRMTSKLSTGLKNQILSKFRPYSREKKIFLIEFDKYQFLFLQKELRDLYDKEPSALKIMQINTLIL